MSKDVTTNEQTVGQSEKVTQSVDGSVYMRGTHLTKDVNAKTVFQDRVMCCQFLKGYSGIDIFKKITRAYT